MKIKKLVNTKKLVHRLYILLWVVLALCLVFKFCFNWWFPIVVENKALNQFFKLLDEYDIAYYFFTLSIYLTIVNLWFLMGIKRKRYPRKLLFFITTGILFSIHLIKWFYMTIGNIVELLFLIVVPTIINVKHKTFKHRWLDFAFPTILYIVINLWQMNMLFIRDVEVILSDVSKMIAAMMQIDYYIFIIISYMEVNNMGLFGGWFFGKSETELLALKEEELKKEHPDEKKLEEIEKELKKFEKEDK